MKDVVYEILALSGFIVAGFFYLISSWRSGDIFVIIGTVLWIFSCFLWLVPTMKNFQQKRSVQAKYDFSSRE